MTQPSRTTETINRDNAGIRDIMHQIRELTVPDRATLALGLVGHLATMMNRSQMTKLMAQLQEEAERVQDVPPSRQREDERADPASAGQSGPGRASAESSSTGKPGEAESRKARPKASPESGRRDDRMTSAPGGQELRTRPHGDVLREHVPGGGRGSHEGVGQEGRGEFRSGRLL